VRLGVLAAAVLALLAAGCGSVRAGAGTGTAGGAQAPAGTARWGTLAPADTQIASVSASGRVLTFAVQVPTGRNGCERGLSAQVTEVTAARAYVRIVFQSRLSSVFGACAYRAVTVRATLPGPLGGRDLVINTSTMFAPGHGIMLRRCSDESGCGPVILVPAACAAPSYQQAMLATAPPADASYQVLGCDGRWLALDVDWPGGPAGCDVPCNPDLVVTRWFFQAGPHGWVTITASAGGCAQVLKAAPQFPARLCSALSAPQ
jgi:hypothetical protein